MMATSVDYDRHALDIENFSFIPVLSFDLLASSEWTDNINTPQTCLAWTSCRPSFWTRTGAVMCNATKPRITILGTILIKQDATVNRAQNCMS